MELAAQLYQSRNEKVKVVFLDKLANKLICAMGQALSRLDGRGVNGLF